MKKYAWWKFKTTFKLSVLSLSHYASAKHENFDLLLSHIIESCRLCSFMASISILKANTPSKIEVTEKGLILIFKGKIQQCYHNLLEK